MSISHIDIIPASDEKFFGWGNTLAANLSPSSGVKEEVVQDIRAEMAEYGELLSKANETQNAAKQAVLLKRGKRQMLEKKFRAEIKRIKAREDYTVAEGARLGIEAPSKSTNLAALAPKITAVDRTGGMVELSFVKHRSDAVHFYGQRDGDTDWVLLGFATSSPFKDQRPLLVTGRVEMRRYTAVYVKRQQEVGAFSDEVVVACLP